MNPTCKETLRLTPYEAVLVACRSAECGCPLTKAPALWVERSVAPGCSSATALLDAPSAPQDMKLGEQRMGKMPLLLHALNAD